MLLHTGLKPVPTLLFLYDLLFLGIFLTSSSLVSFSAPHSLCAHTNRGFREKKHCLRQQQQGDMTEKGTTKDKAITVSPFSLGVCNMFNVWQLLTWWWHPISSLGYPAHTDLFCRYIWWTFAVALCLVSGYVVAAHHYYHPTRVSFLRNLWWDYVHWDWAWGICISYYHPLAQWSKQRKKSSQYDVDVKIRKSRSFQYEQVTAHIVHLVNITSSWHRHGHMIVHMVIAEKIWMAQITKIKLQE